MVPVVSITCGIFLILFGLIYYLADKTPLQTKESLTNIATNQKTKSPEATKTEVQTVSCTEDSSEKECPLKIEVYPGYEIPHEKGQDIDGIIWEDGDSEMRLTLSNKSLARIDNVSFNITSESLILKAAQATRNPGVTIGPDAGGGEIIIVAKGEDGVEHSYPSSYSSTFSAQYKLIVRDLAASEKINIVMACFTLGHTFIGPPLPFPGWFRINGIYETHEAGSHKRYQYDNTFTLKRH